MFTVDYKKLAIENTNFRTVLFTGKYSQVVAMSLLVNEDIGEEVHAKTDQIILIVKGEGEAILDGEAKMIGKDDVVFVPAGTVHNFQNVGLEELKLLTVYAPPQHPDGTIHKTKADAKED